MAGPNIYDQIINGTFADPAMQTQGWGTSSPPPVPTPTVQPGMLGRGLPASMGLDRLPQGSAGLPGPAGSGLTPQQLAALGGWTVDPRTGQLGYVPTQQNPAVTAATQQAQNAPLPRPRPPNAPTWMDIAAMQQQGANPGIGGAMIGNGQMSPQIPPQGPPPAGVAPTRWAGDGSGAGYGGAQPQMPAGPTGTTGAGYQYINGVRTGQAPWAQGMSPSKQYGVANALGQMNAQNRQANATGQAGGWNYVNGQRTGTVGGVTPQRAYDQAAAAARQSSPDNGGNPSWW